MTATKPSSDPLHVETWGSGTPVVFIHGLGASGRYWEPLRSDLTVGYRGIAPDLLGFGRSPAPSDAAYDVHCHLAALEPHIPSGSLIVAHSTGAILAAALAARRPDLTARLVLLGVPIYRDAAAARASVGRLGLMARLTATGSPVARMMCQAMCKMRPLAIVIAPHLVRDLPAAIASDVARHTWASYHGTLERVVIDHRAGPDLLIAGVPTLLLHGSDDHTAPLRDVQELAASAQSVCAPIELRVLGGDHHLAVHLPQLIARAIEPFCVPDTTPDHRT